MRHADGTQDCLRGWVVITGQSPSPTPPTKPKTLGAAAQLARLPLNLWALSNPQAFDVGTLPAQFAFFFLLFSFGRACGPSALTAHTETFPRLTQHQINYFNCVRQPTTPRDAWIRRPHPIKNKSSLLQLFLFSPNSRFHCLHPVASYFPLTIIFPPQTTLLFHSLSSTVWAHAETKT